MDRLSHPTPDRVPPESWPAWVLATSFTLLAEAHSLGNGPVPVSPQAPQAAAPSSLSVALDQLHYRVDTLASSFRVSIVLAPVPGAGILSYGVTLKFDDSAFELGRPSIEIPAGLNFNGFAGPGALSDSGPGFVSVKGTVDFLGQAVVRYDAALILSVVLEPKNVEVGQTTLLDLEPYFTAGPNESLFIDGNGQVLDSQLAFQSAIVEFVPEPSSATLLAIGAAILGSRRRRRPQASTPPCRTPARRRDR